MTMWATQLRTIMGQVDQALRQERDPLRLSALRRFRVRLLAALEIALEWE